MSETIRPGADRASRNWRDVPLIVALQKLGIALMVEGMHLGVTVTLTSWRDADIMLNSHPLIRAADPAGPNPMGGSFRLAGITVAYPALHPK